MSNSYAVNILRTANVALSNFGGQTSSASSVPPPVMPEPQPLDSSGGDPMSMIYELMSKQRNNDMASGAAHVDRNQELKKAQQVKEEADFKKQEDAKESAATWGIFGKIASVVAIAVSAVLAACSCGAASGLCVAACVLSTLAFAEGEAQVLTRLTGNPDADKAFQIGAGIAAALCSGGAGLASIGATTVKTLAGIAQAGAAACEIGQQALGAVKDKGCQDAAMALGIAGATCALGGSVASVGAAAKEAGNAAKLVVKASAEIGQGVAEIGGGVSTIGSSQYEADATDRAADAKGAQMQIDQLQRLADWVIDGIKDTDKSHQHALQTLEGAIQTQAQTLVVATAKA